MSSVIKSIHKIFIKAHLDSWPFK